MVEEPEVAVNVPPVHVLVILAGLATKISTGMLSIKSIEVAGWLLAELSKVNVRVETSPLKITSGVKDLANNNASLTVNVSVADPLFPKLLVKSPVVLR